MRHPGRFTFVHEIYGRRLHIAWSMDAPNSLSDRIKGGGNLVESTTTNVFKHNFPNKLYDAMKDYLMKACVPPYLYTPKRSTLDVLNDLSEDVELPEEDRDTAGDSRMIGESVAEQLLIVDPFTDDSEQSPVTSEDEEGMRILLIRGRFEWDGCMCTTKLLICVTERSI